MPENRLLNLIKSINDRTKEMPYILETCIAGRTMEIRKYYTTKYQRIGGKRSPRRKPTSEEQHRINLRAAIRKLTRKMNANFIPGDYHVVLDYRPDQRPDTWEEMTKDAQAFLKRMRRICRKEGIVLKYIRVMERGARGARHHHFVMNMVPLEVITKCWTKGRVHINLLDETGQYRKLAEYFLKFTDAAVRRGELKKRWEPSKNLKDPVIRKKVISRRFYRETIRTPKGWYLDKDTVKEYVDVNGCTSFSYTLIKIRGDSG